ncbi:hypothetical protein [Conexibacter sp. DBS9H8]|uniref:hypothetical protein n=1 Tax=Conexibacter sp. DBS9H8 TaxID=2937801 RepID=UPI00200F3AAA|nr:hypothetical protein [Conexibacter sp. DBS9H8]
MARLLRLLSLLCCAFVVASFLLFAVSQTSHASAGQAEAIANGTISGPNRKSVPISREAQPRRFIDQVTAQLESPFRSIVSTDSRWMRHLIETGLSLLLYGFLLGFIARWASARAF